MPSELGLISSEKIAAILFIISSFQSLFSSLKAEEVELEKQQNKKTTPRITNLTRESIQLALDSTWIALLAYLLFLIDAKERKDQLEQQIQAGTTNISTIPNELLILGFTLSTIGSITRIPAIEQRLAEAQTPVIL